MLWLFDEDRTQTAVLPEYESIVTTLRFSEHSSFSGKFPATAFSELDAAYFAQVQGEDELYLVEYVELVKDGDDSYAVASGRSATALLHQRIVEGTTRWSSKAPGLIVSDIIGTLTGDRALHGLTFGTGSTLGDAISMQQSWGDMGEVVRSILSAAYLGCRASLDGTDVVFDVYAPSEVSQAIGDAYGNASGAKLAHDDSGWKNYAIVMGEGEGEDRVRLDVDARVSGDELREVYVDASDLQSLVDDVQLTDAEYEAVLEARGIEVLADSQYIEYADATLTTPLSPGDVVFYDGSVWSAELMVSEATTTYEGGAVKYGATIGVPAVTIQKMISAIASRGTVEAPVLDADSPYPAYLLGDGAGMRLECGYVSITPSAANTPTKASVTFDTAFGSIPYVWCCPNTGVPGTQVTGCSCANNSTTGMDVYLTRTNTTSTGVWWFAVGS